MREPYAYFITFSTYGTRLHGDERGSRRRNAVGHPRTTVSGNERRQRYEFEQLQHEPVLLDEWQRIATSVAIREVCRHRAWELHALNVRSNHVHVLVSGSAPPVAMMVAFKAWATRLLRSSSPEDPNRRFWTRHGSTRYVWNEAEAKRVWHYIVHGQDGPPDTD